MNVSDIAAKLCLDFMMRSLAANTKTSNKQLDVVFFMMRIKKSAFVVHCTKSVTQKTIQSEKKSI